MSLTYANTPGSDNFGLLSEFDPEELFGPDLFCEGPSDNAGNKKNYLTPYIPMDGFADDRLPQGSRVQHELDEQGYDDFVEEFSDYNYSIPEDSTEEFSELIFYFIPSLKERIKLAKNSVGGLKKLFGFEKVNAACQIVAEEKWFWGVIERWQEVYDAIKVEATKLLKKERMQKAS